MPQFSFIIAAIVLNVLLLIVLILPLTRLLRRQNSRLPEEAARTRERLMNSLSEQEAITPRQAHTD